MTTPTTEDLLIMVNANVVTDNIHFKSITIINERGNRASTASFTIENGAALNIAQLQSVVIYSADMTTIYFNGFITQFSTTKKGVQVDYAIECSSVEFLLLRSNVNGSFTGTDDEILTALLANAYPDLSDFFDWSSGITPLLTSDINLDLQDMNLLDALDALSAKAGGAEYAQGYNDVARTNIIKNPALTFNMNYYDGAIIANTIWADNTYAAWNSANVVYNSTAGENGGGIVITSQTFAKETGFLQVGRSSQASSYQNLFHVSKTDDLYFAMGCRAKSVSAGSNLVIDFVVATYSEDGTLERFNFLANLDSIASDSSWHDAFGVVSLAHWTIPASGWIEIQMRFTDSGAGANSFVVTVDQFIFEFVYGAVPPGSSGTYFTGETTGAYWLGTANASASALGANPLTWGSNRDAPFDVDIGNMIETLEDFKVEFNGFNSINAMIMTGGFQWVDIDWEYEGNGNAVDFHFDLEQVVYFPASGGVFPRIYKNTGTDGTPVWTQQTVATLQTGFTPATVLYDREKHWVKWQTAPNDLLRSWRIVGRIKERIRTTVQNGSSISSTGLELVDTMYNDTLNTTSEAFDLAQNELARREPSATVEFNTNEPGLLAGDEIQIADTAQDFDEALVIERVTRTYLGGGYGEFHVECGKYTETLDDIIYVQNNENEPKVPLEENYAEVVVGLLVDSDLSILLDADGNQLLNIT